MDEFWGIVLGAVLATLGGIIASLVAEWIKSWNQKREQKIECYKKLLSFCLAIKTYNVSKTVITYQEISDAVLTAQLYASEKVYNLFLNFSDLSMKYMTKFDDHQNIDKEFNELSNQYDIILNVVKKELRLISKNSRKGDKCNAN